MGLRPLSLVDRTAPAAEDSKSKRARERASEARRENRRSGRGGCVGRRGAPINCHVKAVPCRPCPARDPSTFHSSTQASAGLCVWVGGWVGGRGGPAAGGSKHVAATRRNAPNATGAALRRRGFPTAQANKTRNKTKAEPSQARLRPGGPSTARQLARASSIRCLPLPHSPFVYVAAARQVGSQTDNQLPPAPHVPIPRPPGRLRADAPPPRAAPALRHVDAPAPGSLIAIAVDRESARPGTQRRRPLPRRPRHPSAAHVSPPRRRSGSADRTAALPCAVPASALAPPAGGRTAAHPRCLAQKDRVTRLTTRLRLSETATGAADARGALVVTTDQTGTSTRQPRADGSSRQGTDTMTDRVPVLFRKKRRHPFGQRDNTTKGSEFPCPKLKLHHETRERVLDSEVASRQISRGAGASRTVAGANSSGSSSEAGRHITPASKRHRPR